MRNGGRGRATPPTDNAMGEDHAIMFGVPRTLQRHGAEIPSLDVWAGEKFEPGCRVICTASDGASGTIDRLEDEGYLVVAKTSDGGDCET